MCVILQAVDSLCVSMTLGVLRQGGLLVACYLLLVDSVCGLLSSHVNRRKNKMDILMANIKLAPKELNPLIIRK